MPAGGVQLLRQRSIAVVLGEKCRFAQDNSPSPCHRKSVLECPLCPRSPRHRRTKRSRGQVWVILDTVPVELQITEILVSNLPYKFYECAVR